VQTKDDAMTMLRITFAAALLSVPLLAVSAVAAEKSAPAKPAHAKATAAPHMINPPLLPQYRHAAATHGEAHAHRTMHSMNRRHVAHGWAGYHTRSAWEYHVARMHGHHAHRHHAWAYRHHGGYPHYGFASEGYGYGYGQGCGCGSNSASADYYPGFPPAYQPGFLAVIGLAPAEPY
jgi:hypothetical protein